MRKYILILIAAFISINTYSQISFEEGYFIDNTNQKIECFIKNNDWRFNPTVFTYKTTLEGEIHEENIKTVKEFGITNFSKYIRTKAKIDKSSGNANNLSTERNPIYTEEVVFLKVLIEGSATLFVYENKSLMKFFYNYKDTIIEPLIYKKYNPSEDIIKVNALYKQQLWTQLKCVNIDLKSIENLDYNTKSLTNFFLDFNNCEKSEIINYQKKPKKSLVHLTLRPRLNFSNLYIQTFQYRTQFGTKPTFGIGLEFEYIFPFNKNKWSISTEPTYQYYKSEHTVFESSPGLTKTKVIDYKSIEIPISLRHYFYLNDNSKLFLDISFIVDVNFNSTIDFQTADGSIYNSLYLQSMPNLAAGFGYNLKNRYSIEVRYIGGRNVLSPYSYWDSKYRTLSFILGYSFF